MPNQIFVATEMTPDIKKKLDEYREKTGITQVQMISRLVHWFSCQPQVVQYLLLDLLPREGRTLAIKQANLNLHNSKPLSSKTKLPR